MSSGKTATPTVAEKKPKRTKPAKKKEDNILEEAKLIHAMLSKEERDALLLVHAGKTLYKRMCIHLDKMDIETGDEGTIIVDSDGYVEYSSEIIEDDDEDEEEEEEEEDEEEDEDIIASLSEYMEEHDKSQEWAAKKFKVSQGSISNWLSGSSSPRGKNLAKLKLFLSRV